MTFANSNGTHGIDLCVLCRYSSLGLEKEGDSKMAAFQTRQDKKGRERVRAIVRKRVKGEVVAKSKTFDSFVEAEQWALRLESNIDEMHDLEEITLGSILRARTSYSDPEALKHTNALMKSCLSNKTLDSINYEAIVAYIVERSANGINTVDIYKETEFYKKIIIEMSDGKAESNKIASFSQAFDIFQKALKTSSPKA